MGKDNHKKRSAQGDASHKKNYKEYTATVDDIERFLSDNVVLRHNVLTGRTEYRVPERDAFTFYLEHLPPWDGQDYILGMSVSVSVKGDTAMQFLSDSTGNRRWLPFEVESIDSPREKPFDYANIYAQAYALYRQDFRYWFSRTEIEQLAVHNRQFETPRLEQELVQMYFRVPSEREPGEEQVTDVTDIF